MAGKPDHDDTRGKNQNRLEAALTPGGLVDRPRPSTQAIAARLPDVHVVRELAAKRSRAIAEVWGKMRFWKLDEAVLLVLGDDPHDHESAKANPLAARPAIRSRLPALRELAERASVCGDFGDGNTGHILPWVFLGWSARMGYEAPAELVRVVEAQGKPPLDLQGMIESLTDSLDTVAKQRDMLLQDRDSLSEIAKRLIAERDGLREENAGLRARLVEQVPTGAQRWPWGSHETDLLRKLADAAELWRPVSEGGNYDPGDKSTAPTNDMVAEKLEKIGVTASRVREIMAQILRADGLPTGPRK
ncbi:hypothetical protein LLG90_19980 [Aromatoleum toluclasticum]|uniref:hypothetical protein n=1 Tax=Aromatoleum toluclasticum TaxID=92003 RepID=UPI001D1828F3|nr:hypothetical protein [Aromatoleum toluclasticum]MCC4117643.1 hypothetical protein [Aromatoleum toluclasticum]